MPGSQDPSSTQPPLGTDSSLKLVEGLAVRGRLVRRIETHEMAACCSDGEE